MAMSCLQSPDGKQMVTGAIDGIVHLFDLATGKLIKTLKGIVEHSCVLAKRHWRY